MKNVIWLTIKNGTGSAVPAFVGYGQLVEDVPMVEDMYYDMILGIPDIVGEC